MKRKWTADQIGIVGIRPDNHCLYRAMAISTGILTQHHGTTDLAKDEEARLAVKTMREAVATEIERHYGALTTQQQKTNQRARMYQDLRPEVRARINPQSLGYQKTRAMLGQSQEFSQQEKQQIQRYIRERGAKDQKKYTHQIRQTQRWGGELEIAAFSRLVQPNLCYVIVIDLRTRAADPRLYAYGNEDTGRAIVLVRTDNNHFDLGICKRSFHQQLQRTLKTSKQLPGRLRQTADTMKRSSELILRLLRQRASTPTSASAALPSASVSAPPVLFPAWMPPIMMPCGHAVEQDYDSYDPDFAEF